MNAHAKLSAREAEVVKLLSEGQAPKEIAFALGISIKTVDFHSGRARQKIGHPSLAILTRYAIVSGLSPLRPGSVSDSSFHPQPPTTQTT